MRNREKGIKMAWCYRSGRLALSWVVVCWCVVFQAAFADDHIRLTHVFIDPDDSTDTITLIESQSENGLSNWFSRDINKSVCTTKQCKMVNIRLYWDGVGNYQRFELIDNEPLTKTDHTEFTSEDYAKLEFILADESSMFQELDIADLVVEKEDEVDGSSGATRKSISEYVVREAVYTCYTLWQIVYGPTKSKIATLLEARLNEGYLKRAFTQNDPVYDVWALNHLVGSASYATLFYKDLLDRIISPNESIANLAMRAIHAQNLNTAVLQQALVGEIPKLDDLKKLDIVWKLAETPIVFDEVIVQLLTYYQDGRLNPTALGYVLKLISIHHLSNGLITEKVKALLTDQNQYVVNTTKKLLVTWEID